MNKLSFLLLPTIILFANNALAGASQIENSQLPSRYGLENIKLGHPTNSSIRHINLLLKTNLVCTEKKISLGKIKRNFTYKACKLPNEHPALSLWNEKLQKLNVSFLDNKLITLSLEFKTYKSYEVLYKNHGKRVQKLLGAPSDINLNYVAWENQSDKATMEDAKNGVIKLEILNKVLHDPLIQFRE